MDKKSAYKQHKFLHLRDDVEKIKDNKIIAPVCVQVFAVNACDMGCLFCAYRETGSESGYLAKHVKLSDRLSDKLLLDLPRQLKEAGVKSIHCSGGGEFLLHKQAKNFFSKMNKFNLGGALVTNGSMMDDETISLIKNFDWVRLSVNGGANSYNDIQRPSKNKKFFQIDDIWKQICKLNKIKGPKTLVGISCVVTRNHIITEDNKLVTLTNANDLYEIALMAKESGCDNVRFSLAFSQNGFDTYDDIWPIVEKQLQKAKELETDYFTVFTLTKERKEDKLKNKSGKSYKECRYTQFTTLINAAGEIVPCCTISYNQISYGSLYDKEFKDIWFSPERFRVTRNIDVNKGLCGSSCFKNEANELLEYMCEKEPLHINYP